MITSINEFKNIFEKKKKAKKKLSDADKEFISNKIKLLMDEGRPQKQAIAMAYSYLDRSKKNESIINESNDNDFILSFKVNMPRTSGRLIISNIKDWHISFELVNIEPNSDDSTKNNYNFKFYTNISNKYIKPNKKVNFFYNNFAEKINKLGYDGYKNLKFDNDAFNGTVTLIKTNN